MRTVWVAAVLGCVACGPALKPQDFAGVYDADIETTVATGESTEKASTQDRFSLTAMSDTELRLEDPQCPVQFVFDKEDDVGFYHFHALATSCSSENGEKTVRIESGWILVDSSASPMLPSVQVEGSATGSEEFGFTIFRRATARF